MICYSIRINQFSKGLNRRSDWGKSCIDMSYSWNGSPKFRSRGIDFDSLFHDIKFLQCVLLEMDLEVVVSLLTMDQGVGCDIEREECLDNDVHYMSQFFDWDIDDLGQC